MSLDVTGILAAVQSHAQQLGVFEQVITNEPKNAPGNGLTCAIWVQRMGTVAAASGLASVSGRVALMVRVLKPMLALPYGQIDPDILTAADALMAAYAGAFTLEGHVRDVDLLGQHGIGLDAQAGYVTIDKKLFRLMDVTLPLIINDLWTETP